MPALEVDSVNELVPMDHDFVMRFEPWSYEVNSDCTFNQYDLLITDRDLNTLQVTYNLNSTE